MGFCNDNVLNGVFGVLNGGKKAEAKAEELNRWTAYNRRIATNDLP